MGNGQTEAVLKPSPRLLDEGTVAGVSDRQLLAQFAAGCDASLAELAFEALVRRHGPMVLRVCRQIIGDEHTAEDAFQATFLVLARRAGSIGQPDLLGNWLYGVALRSAREARMREARRRRCESPNGERIGESPDDDAGQPEWSLASREEFEMLHEEVSQLPERYRVPVVLCELEGLTHQQAALRMRCPVSTVGVRLKRARERLRVRLTRRGLAPSAGLAGALLGAGAASAWVPSSVLMDSTIRAATHFAARQAATGLVSSPVIALTEAVLRTMALSRLKIAVRLVLALGMTASVGWVSTHREPWRPPASVSTASVSNSVLPAQGDLVPRAQGERPRPEPLPANPATPLLTDRPSPAPQVPPKVESALANEAKPIVERRQVERAGPVAELVKLPEARSPKEARALGEVLFAKEWVPNDPMSHGGDGLGPVYNETSCMACHGQGAPGGAGPESKNVV
jgi:RNA polymerase sigma factor (sigma-70 family)